MGASTAEAWTGAEGLGRLADFAQLIKDWPQKVQQAETALAVYQREAAEWDAHLDSHDAGYADGKAVWAAPGFDDSQWQKMNLPTHWEKAGFPDLDGFMWFRKAVDLNALWCDQDLTLGLGTINDMDRVWFNGTEVGRFERTAGWTKPREYPVPGRLVREGRNVITVRVYDIGNNGGICGSAADMWLRINDNEQIKPVSLAGKWLCKLGLDLRTITPRPQPLDFSESNKRMPTGLYNGMIYPLAPFAIKGVVWYQGESNAGRAGQYQQLLTAMIDNWRELWKEGDFPFGIVQLPNFMQRRENPSQSSWAELREAQFKTAMLVKNCGLAVTIDIGEADYIHPRDKQDVGKRLALWALARVYGRKIEYSGPLFKTMQIKENRVILNFFHDESGLTTRDNKPLTGFAVAGADSVFHWAKGKIEDKKVIVWSDEVPEPRAVRYAWADNPDCNLYNKAGLPAAPFRMDNW
jgi:sialate O-acetylesterase